VAPQVGAVSLLILQLVLLTTVEPKDLFVTTVKPVKSTSGSMHALDNPLYNGQERHRGRLRGAITSLARYG
jgi:hypothetical protein